MIKIKKLDNGIRVCLEQMPEYNSVAMGIWVMAGAANETKENAGISHFCEHMMFKGTKSRDAAKLAEDVDRIGSQSNAFTGKEATCYYIRSLSKNMEESLEILLDMFTNSLFDEKELKRERNVIFEEMNMVADQPDENAMDIICELALKGTPYENDVLGKKTSLRKMSSDMLKGYVRDQYTKDSIVVAAAGKFDEKKFCRMVDKALGHLKARKKKVKYGKIDHKPSYRVKVKDIEQAHLCLGIPSLGLNDEGTYPFAILSKIMGGSMSSRLFQNVRERKGLAYVVYSANSALANGGYYTIYAGVSKDKIADCIEAINEELVALDKSGVTKEELEKAKEQMKALYIYAHENVNSRMFIGGRDALLCGKVVTQEEVLKTIDRVTMDDIEAAKHIICDISRYSAVLISNERMNLKKMINS